MLNNDFVKSNLQLNVNSSSSSLLLLLLLLGQSFPCSLKNGVQCLKRHYHDGLLPAHSDHGRLLCCAPGHAQDALQLTVLDGAKR